MARERHKEHNRPEQAFDSYRQNVCHCNRKHHLTPDCRVRNSAQAVVDNGSFRCELRQPKHCKRCKSQKHYCKVLRSISPSSDDAAHFLFVRRLGGTVESLYALPRLISVEITKDADDAVPHIEIRHLACMERVNCGHARALTRDSLRAPTAATRNESLWLRRL